MNALNFYIYRWIHLSRVLWFGLNHIIRSSSESLRVENDTMTWNWPRLPPNSFVHWCLSSFRIRLQLKERCWVIYESITVFVMLVRTYNCWQWEARGSLFFIRLQVILTLFTVCVCVVAIEVARLRTWWRRNCKSDFALELLFRVVSMDSWGKLISQAVSISC